MYQAKAQIMHKEEVAPGIFRMKLFSEQVALSAKPGQFIHVKVGNEQSFILRRPFSIHRLAGRGTFEILFEVRGQGTAFLSQEPVRSQLDLIGPLGRGFEVDEGTRNVLFVAGGLGIAPLMFLADDLSKRQLKAYFLLGAQTEEKMLYYIDLKRIGRKVYATTDDGTFGHRGRVTDLLGRALIEARPDQVFVCGPPAMIKATALNCLEEEVACQVSVERRMGCGIGACFSCVCRVRKNNQTEYQRACVEGPVFDARRILWDEFT